jgi:recombinational DNA repair protein RecT
MTTLSTTNQAFSQFAKDLNGEFYRTQLKGLLGSDAEVDNFIAIGKNSLVLYPEILKCESKSLLKAFLKIAQLGLKPNQQQVAIVSFENRATGEFIATVIPQWQGIVAIAKRDAGITINVEYVLATEEMDLDYIMQHGTHVKDSWYDIEKIKPFKEDGKNKWGKPNYTFDLENVKTHFKGIYAVIDTEGEPRKIETFRMVDMIKKMKASKTFGKSGFYLDWFEEMLKKTVIRYSLKKKIHEIPNVNKRLSEVLQLENNYEEDKITPLNTDDKEDITKALENNLPPPEDKGKMAGATLTANTKTVLKNKALIENLKELIKQYAILMETPEKEVMLQIKTDMSIEEWDEASIDSLVEKTQWLREFIDSNKKS